MQAHRNRDREGAALNTYLITFATYGSHLPGQHGTVDSERNLYGSPLGEPNAIREKYAREQVITTPYILDAPRRDAVLKSINDVCRYRSWTLIAAHVRTNHVHAVVSASL